MKLRAKLFLSRSESSNPRTHPLAVEQREGITVDRWKQILARVLHPSA